MGVGADQAAVEAMADPTATATAPTADTADTADTATVPVALGRRVEVIGDLLLPPEPTDSSRAACRDIAQRLDEWQGPGIVVVCGRLVAPGSAEEPAAVVERHAALTDALETFAARADSQVIVVLPSSERDPALVQALERHRRKVCALGRARNLIADEFHEAFPVFAQVKETEKIVAVLAAQLVGV